MVSPAVAPGARGSPPPSACRPGTRFAAAVRHLLDGLVADPAVAPPSGEVSPCAPLVQTLTTGGADGLPLAARCIPCSVMRAATPALSPDSSELPSPNEVGWIAKFDHAAHRHALRRRRRAGRSPSGRSTARAARPGPAGCPALRRCTSYSRLREASVSCAVPDADAGGGAAGASAARIASAMPGGRLLEGPRDRTRRRRRTRSRCCRRARCCPSTSGCGWPTAAGARSSMPVPAMRSSTSCVIAYGSPPRSAWASANFWPLGLEHDRAREDARVDARARLEALRVQPGVRVGDHLQRTLLGRVRIRAEDVRARRVGEHGRADRGGDVGGRGAGADDGLRLRVGGARGNGAQREQAGDEDAKRRHAGFNVPARRCLRCPERGRSG